MICKVYEVSKVSKVYEVYRVLHFTSPTDKLYGQVFTFYKVYKLRNKHLSGYSKVIWYCRGSSLFDQHISNKCSGCLIEAD